MLIRNFSDVKSIFIDHGIELDFCFIEVLENVGYRLRLEKKWLETIHFVDFVSRRLQIYPLVDLRKDY